MRWVKNWLNRPAQGVLISGQSYQRPVTAGVPQESILAPALFRIFINNLDDGGRVQPQQFAGDTRQGGVADMPEGPRQVGEMGQQEPHKLQQGQVQSPARQEEQPQAAGWKTALPKRTWGHW